MELLLRYRTEIVLFAGTLLSAFGAMHFLASLYLWGQYFAGGGEGRFELATLLTCGIAVLLFPIYVWALALFVRGRGQGWKMLAGGIMLSAAFFITDVRRGNFQTERMMRHIGQSAGANVGTRHYYLNWWWYSDVEYWSPKAAPAGLSGDRTARAGS